ncbi:MAG: hypothetical protein ACI4C1_04410 [Lachnospiraceae bacterium]
MTSSNRVQGIDASGLSMEGTLYTDWCTHQEHLSKQHSSSIDTKEPLIIKVMQLLHLAK